MSSINVVLCNCPAEQAEPLARALAEQRLAACVNLLPGVTSLYRWEGSVRADAEVTLLIKTASDRVEALREGILALHPHKVPEFVVLRVDGTASLPAYLEWVINETRPNEGVGDIRSLVRKRAHVRQRVAGPGAGLWRRPPPTRSPSPGIDRR